MNKKLSKKGWKTRQNIARVFSNLIKMIWPIQKKKKEKKAGL